MASSAIKQKTLTSLCVAAAVFYLCFHTIHGEQGLYALVVESYRLEKLEVELAELTKEREALEHRASMLRDGSLDPDLLDEETRRALGYANAHELVVIAPGDSQ